MRYIRRVAFLSVALLGAAAVAADDPFLAWLDDVRAEAVAGGVDGSVVDAAFHGLEKPSPRVLELDRRQLRRDITLDDYLKRVVSADRVRSGREMGRRHRALLEQVAARYGVQPRFILAIWGIETHYGKVTGSFPVIGALATLAYDGRRSSYFRGQLLEALRILDQERIAPDAMLGSWAGAMGQSQFMPSSFTDFAQDYDRDGRRDIWTSEADVFASIAHYLARHGWRDDITWGREVRLPAGFSGSQVGLDVIRTIPEWSELGIRRADGTALPTRELEASVVAPEHPEGRAYLIYQNFRTTLAYNRSSLYATAVGVLSDRIARGL